MLLDEVWGHEVEEVDDVVGGWEELIGGEGAGGGGDDVLVVELEGVAGAIEEVLHGAGVQDVEGPAAVGAFDVEGAGELGGFEVDVVVAEELGDFVEEVFGADGQGLEGEVGAEDDGGEGVVVGGAAAFGVGGVGFIVVVKSEEVVVAVLAVDAVVGVLI